MNFLQAIKLSRIGLIALMLLAQSAVAQHSVDHAFHDATEFCEIYISAETPSLVESSQSTWNISSYALTLNDSFRSQLSDQKPATLVARGPPQVS